MAIGWTKVWQSVDDGTVLTALDLKNIQEDIDDNVGNAITIHGHAIAEPVAGDDGRMLFWDNANSTYDYVGWDAPLAIGGTTPAAGAFTTLEVGTTNQGDVLYDNGTSLVRLPPGTSGQALLTGGAAANPSWGNVGGEASTVGGTGQKIFTTDGTFTVPAGITKVFLTMIGGGGSGGGTSNTNQQGGGGGAGASVINYPLEVTPGATLTVQVGLGGTGVNSSTASGEASIFDTATAKITANGGSGGTANSANAAGGSGGTVVNKLAAVNTVAGTFIENGSSGFAGGAGAAGLSGTGSGGGGGSLMGAGGAGVTVQGNGISASESGQYGGGGSGALTVGGTIFKGGDGADGIVIVRW